jgi:hypothetical protein
MRRITRLGELMKNGFRKWKFVRRYSIFGRYSHAASSAATMATCALIRTGQLIVLVARTLVLTLAPSIIGDSWVARR